MKKLQVYVDTSVLGGCFEPEFAFWSKGLIADFLAEIFTPVLSTLLETELRRAPDPYAPYSELLALAGSRFRSATKPWPARATSPRVLGSKFRSEWVHIALATFGRVDVCWSGLSTLFV